MIRTYFSFFRMRFLALLQYRAAALAGMSTNWAFGMMRVMVMIAFYASADRAQPMSLAQAITYTWLSQLMLGMLPWTLDKEVSNSVITGQVAYELTRPIDIYSMWFMRTLAFRAAPTLMRGIPIFIICSFVLPTEYGIQLPGIHAFCAYFLSVFGALILSVSITSLMHAYVLVMQKVDGLTRMVNAMAELLSGMIIPLGLMPECMAGFLRYQPFASIIDLPAQLFCGTLPPSQIWSVIATQLVWTLIFVVSGRAVTEYGLKKVVLAGG